MDILRSVANIIVDIATYIYNLHVSAQRIPVIGNWVGDVLYSLYLILYRIAGALIQFSDWLSSIVSQIRVPLSISDVLAAIQDWINKAEYAFQWVANACQNISNMIAQALSPVYQNVLNIVSNAVSPIISIINSIQPKIDYILGTISGEVSNFIRDPVGWVRNVFTNNILPWIRSAIPEFSWLFESVSRFGNTIISFFSDIANSIWNFISDRVVALIRAPLDIIQNIVNWWNEIKSAIFAFVQDPPGWILFNVVEPAVHDFMIGFDRGLNAPEPEDEELEEEDEQQIVR